MTKRTPLFLLLCCVSSVTALAQQPNCSVSTKLVCQLPVASGSLGAATFPPFNAALATQLSQLPLASPASGVSVILSPQGTPVVSENLGPILTDRAETIGRHRLFVGFFYQRFRFNSIDGTGLGAVPLLGQTGTSSVIQYVAETENIDFKLDQYVGLVTFGLTDTLDVSVAIPIERVSLGVTVAGNQYFVLATYDPQGNPTYTQGGQQSFSNNTVHGSASGIGDVLANVKKTFWGKKGEEEKPFKFAAGMFMRFPSGDALNYLGSGAFGFNPYAIASYQWKVSPHARIGYLWNTSSVLNPNAAGRSSQLPGGFQYDFGADWSIIKQVTLAGDFFGNQYLNSPTLSLKTTTIPAYNVPFPNLQAGTSSYTVNYFSIGGKYKPVANLILYANALFQLNNVGLRSNIVPLFGISYKFGK